MWESHVLGCGPSLGVPIIGCKCKVCASTNPRNKRLRSSLHLKYFNSDDNKEINSKNSEDYVSILIDSGCDVRCQMLRANITHLNAVIITHPHMDHIGGIDDLRPLARQHISKYGTVLPIYADNYTINKVKEIYNYLFVGNNLAELREIVSDGRININGLEIQSFVQHHGSINSLGIRVENFVYSNDVISFPTTSHRFLKDIEVWILDCLQHDATHSHAGIKEVQEWCKEFNPKKVYLTNMNHNMDYEQLITLKPIASNISPAYDGLKITFNSR